MPATTDVRDDLGYVRDVVNRSERSAFPSAIAYLWAAIGVVGFSACSSPRVSSSARG